MQESPRQLRLLRLFVDRWALSFDDLTASCYKLSTNSVIRSNASLIDFTLHSKGW